MPKRRWKADEVAGYAVVAMDGTDDCPLDRMWVSSVKRHRYETIEYARGIWPGDAHLSWAAYKRKHQIRIARVRINEL